MRILRVLADVEPYIFGVENVEAEDNAHPLPAPLKRRVMPQGGVPGLSRTQACFYQTLILRGLAKIAGPLTAAEVNQLILKTAVNAETTRRLLGLLVAEGRVTFRCVPGRGHGVRSPLLVYELARPEGGAA